MTVAGGRPFGPKTGIALPTFVLLAVICLTAGYLGVCQKGDSYMCPQWSMAPPPYAQPRGAAAAAAAAQLRGNGMILGYGEPFLPLDALMRGTASYGSGHRMERLGVKLLQGKPITVAFLGGSITWGRGGYEGGSFVNRFTAWLNATFPHPDHKIINQGLPAVTSALFAACYDKVPEDTDLVVLDFTVNDGHAPPDSRDRLGYSFDSGARRGFEQLVRKSMKLRGGPAVALLHFFSWNATRDKVEDEEGLDVPVGQSFFWRTIEDDFGTMAAYYDLPSLSLRNAVYHLLREQRFGFQWNVSIHFANNAVPKEEDQYLKESQFFWDENHPWDRTGHRALAELLMAAVTRGVQAAAVTQLTELARTGGKLSVPPPELPELPALPPPMVTGNYEANATSCHMQEEFKAVIRSTDGFVFEPRAPQEETFVAQKWGLTAHEPGAVATLQLDSELGGLSGKLKQVQVHLLFLRSWHDMGRAKIKCISGCKCSTVELDGHWDREATLTDLFTLQVSPHPECVLEVTVLKETSSGEHMFSLSGAVVSSVDARMERGKIGQWEYDKQKGR